MRSRIAFPTHAAIVLLVGSATAVSAAPAATDRGPFEFDVSATISGVCAFDFDLSAHISGTSTFVATANNQHVGIQIHTTEVDTLTGPNRIPLVSDPYTSSELIGFDGVTGDGHDFGTGHMARFQLPGGDVFMSAGRVTSIGGYVITPDTGRSGDVAALCAALD
jgi:hypothetical protein